MISIDDLKNVPLLQGLPDQVFEKLLKIAQLESVKEGDVVYDAEQEAENLYMVKNGKVVLESDLMEGTAVTLASIKPGYIFGWYGMIPSSHHSMRAVATTDSDLIVLPGYELRMFMDDDHTFGYQFMNKIFMLMKLRLDRRTSQFLKVLAKHPDLQG
ncbi:Crp/Fnr family transcriptional regulator [Desulfovibrio ferrophilus]|uniref:Putative transcriptional regulator, Crp/Fnr family n=1 Tax=Desulfovibrio ferrophilus TaxID=241368 RepID=A0A2Z6AXU5_9BACT|nr:cyclic nucleotide-binding domain-containing protein [Desulfovibrio ferrophilus]BBD08025.1 putative transcriptional regulator, Crp/Fnr family [Desulfovibrio ferrophilus]